MTEVNNTPVPEKTGIMKFFPLPTARPSQEVVIREIDKVFKSGTNIVVLEAPVGSGKSAIAITLAKSLGLMGEVGVGGAHIITPRKSLQDQYFEDFSEDIVLMKGRNAYPCTFESTPRQYVSTIKAIKEGRIKPPDRGSPDCGDAPCKGDSDVFQLCTEDRECPYGVAIKVAQDHSIVIHNLHSFIFQSNFGLRFDKRGILIVDEAHEIENTVRGFISKKIFLKGTLKKEETAAFKSINDWTTFLFQDKYIPEETERDRNLKTQDKTYVSKKEEYLRIVESLSQKDFFDKGFSVEINPTFKTSLTGTKTPDGVVLEFIPHYVGGAVRNMLLDYGDKILLMSGTIYDKDLFCRNLGIRPEEAHFIRIGSSFPKQNRPIYLKREYQVNTSHANWNENFADLIEVIKKIMVIFKDAKGLIHAPSYLASEQIKNALNDPRVVNHSPQDFLTKLDGFFSDKEPKVFISPVCQQGVDFKDDRARFQIVIRVPYMSTGSAFVEDKVKNDFPWYNYQALIVFGQQIGRINRSDNDYGATFLVDDRFNKFISRNAKALPTWVKEGMVWK